MRDSICVSRDSLVSPIVQFWIGVLLLGALLLVSHGNTLNAAKAREISDQEITRAVESALLLDENVPSHLIDVRTEHGIVTLSGMMPHFRSKGRAVNVVETVRGVQSVINGLTVTVSKRTDEEIRDKVQKALKEDPATDSYQIKVDVDHGAVTLTGSVPSWAAWELSEWVASGVYGVREINNRLVIDVEETRSDEAIVDEIQTRLESDVWVNEDSFLVSVKDGVVTLDGVVGSVAEKRQVTSNAHVAGVKKVDGQLLFVKAWAKGKMKRRGQPGYKDDTEIKDTLILAYAYDPRVSVFNPTIDVRHGIVTLTGVVDNLHAKRAAEKVARYTRGVLWVKNLLKVRPKDLIEDNALKRKVEMALHDDIFLNRFQVNVDVHNGTVLLRGSVESQFQKNHAEDVVSGVKGVVDIKNKLTVDETWTWRPDAVTKREIESELWWSPFVDSDDIAVTVKAGVATLSGTVDSYLEYETAIENAREGGARRVKSLLTIRKY
ncbi:BON domain-containing protein [Nitrospira sp. M1]